MMNIKMLSQMLVVVALGGALLNLIAASTVFAQSSTNITITCRDGTTMNVHPSLAANGDPCGSRGGTENNPSGVGAASNAPSGPQNVRASDDVKTGVDGELDKWLNNAINILSAAVGLVVVGSIIFAGIQYQTARDNASQVSAARNRIAMGVLALILYFFAYAALQWLVPGGVF